MAGTKPNAFPTRAGALSDSNWEAYTQYNDTSEKITPAQIKSWIEGFVKTLVKDRRKDKYFAAHSSVELDMSGISGVAVLPTDKQLYEIFQNGAKVEPANFTPASPTDLKITLAEAPEEANIHVLFWNL